MERRIKKYTHEFKQESVSLALKSSSVAKTAMELGIPVPTLHSWIKQTKYSSNAVKDGKDLSSLVEEIRRVHKELLRAQEERDLLKKAAAYFAQHQK